MPKQFSSEWYYEQLIKDAKENPTNRTFTIQHVPKAQQSKVIKLLNKNYGGNSTDKQLGNFAKNIAISVPIGAASIAFLPKIAAAVTEVAKNPVFWKNVVLPYLGGEVTNKVVQTGSNNKYQSFGDWAYKNSGLDVFNNPGVKEAIQLLLESANPGLYASTFGKLAKTGLNKTLSAVTPQISKSIENNTKLRQLKYKINNYVNGLEDLKNHIKYPKKAGSMYFDNWKQDATKTVVGDKTIYNKGNYILTESPGRMLFTDTDDTFRVGTFTDNSYYVTVTPPYGKDRAPLSTVKTVYNIVDQGTPGTYFVADPTSLPKGLTLKDLYDRKEYGELLKSIIGLDSPFELALSGYSTDAHKYINLFRTNPSVTTRYNPVPMKQFNSLGQDAVNKQLLTWMTVADVADNPTTKKVMLDKINAQFSKINAEPAFIDEGLVQIPQPSLMIKYPITTSVTPAELLADSGFK